MAEPPFTWIEIPDPRLHEIATTLAAHPRMSGYYILRLIDITAIRAQVGDDDRMLDAVFEQLDGRTWPPYEERLDLGRWRDQAAPADDARAEVVTALIGGRDVGHTRDTMSAAVAAQTWELFASLFAPERTYYNGLGLGDPRYVYMRGAAIVDATRAGYLGVVEGD